MNTSNSLGQFSFDDFLNLKTPTTASGNDSNSLSFSLIPPTPHDLRNRPFPSPNPFGSSVGSGLPFEIASPPPFGGIMSPKYEQQHDSLRPRSGFRSTYGEDRRPPSVTSQGHRHEPYKTTSRQSSISSLSGAMQGSDGASSDWQWDSNADEARHSTEPEGLSSSPLSNAGLSICPADLQVNPRALRLQRSMPSFATQIPLPKVELDDSDDSDAQSEMASPIAYSRKPRSSVPAPILPTTPYSNSRRQVSPATTTWSRSSAPTRISRDRKPSRSYREESEIPDSPILVTAITSSGKKSHARKASHPLIRLLSTRTNSSFWFQRPQNHIPRPRNAFILFRKHVVDSKLIPSEVEIRHQNISVVVAKMWAEADAVTKARFQEDARREKEQHMRDYPDYKYQPVYRRTGAARRQIKADPVEVKKCNLVANLLLDGKKGEELKKETKRAVERSNKKRAKVAKSLAEARARNNQARRQSRMRSESQSAQDSDDYEDATDVDQESEGVAVNIPGSRHEASDTPTTVHAAPSVVSQLGHQFSGQDFMRSTSVSRITRHAHEDVATHPGPMGNAPFMFSAAGEMVFDPAEILAFNQDNAQRQHAMQQQQQMGQSSVAPPSHYVLAMHSNNAPELQFVQQSNQFGMSITQHGQSSEQVPVPWPTMSDEDLLGYADAFNMMANLNGQPWPNMS